MAKRHLYNKGGDYKLFDEDNGLDEALESREWFKTEKEALECDTPIVEDGDVKTIEDFSDEEIVKEAEARELLESDKNISEFSDDEIKAEAEARELFVVEDEELDNEVDLDKLSEEEVRSLGKKAGIQNYHNLGLDKLKTKLLEL